MRDRVFAGYALTVAFAYASLFGYISGSSLAHEDQRGDETVQLPRDRRPRARGRSDAIAPNFLSADDTSEVSDAYSPGVLARLVAVKDRYDPDNVFRINNNIAPSA